MRQRPKATGRRGNVPRGQQNHLRKQVERPALLFIPFYSFFLVRQRPKDTGRRGGEQNHLRKQAERSALLFIQFYRVFLVRQKPKATGRRENMLGCEQDHLRKQAEKFPKEQRDRSPQGRGSRDEQPGTGVLLLR